MSIDPRAMVKRHASELVLVAVAVAFLGVALCGSVAHAQGLDPATPHAVDWLSAAVGGGGITGLGAVLLALAWAGNKLGLSLPRIVIGGKAAPPAPSPAEEATAPPPTAEVPRPADGPTREDFTRLSTRVADLAHQVGALKADMGSLTSSVSYNSGTAARIEARQEALSQTANQIMLLLAGKGGR